MPNVTDVCQKTFRLDAKKQTIDGVKAIRWDDVNIEVKTRANIFEDDLGTSSVRSVQLNGIPPNL
jgi:hypothetical protein